MRSVAALLAGAEPCSTLAAACAQMVALTMMALALSEDSIRLRARRNAVVDALGVLPDQLREVLKLDCEMLGLAEQLKHEQSLLVFGRGYNYATALEAALKARAAYCPFPGYAHHPWWPPWHAVHPSVALPRAVACMPCAGKEFPPRRMHDFSAHTPRLT
jgi:uncharacterized protein with PIN domain